ncbi:GNAT family N-acetyltransferase [Solimicrobium silvestre]|uniref:Acetyltransferase (GNAT) domain n=1 Tax=Solimicrobium silvestre TaxID=2099400 RepID=A0A2S9GX28_9BURK|nr:GNAT family N-acetyltransferase [Solimicrobium silvestre]PRC92272.1 Acetyltransferase (GNAT) domain [Solimicrobium silvestre]
MTTIRLADLADASNLAALGIQVWLHTYATSGIHQAISDYVLAEFTAEKFQQLLIAPDHIVLIAEKNAHLVGYAVLKLDARCNDVSHTSTELVTLYVQEHFTRQNIGTALLSACADYAQQSTGSALLWLSVNQNNTRASTFYHQHGFRKYGVTYFEIGSERHANDILAKPSAS